MNDNSIRERITELRLKKGVSEYEMSLSLGHSRSYIQNISSGRTLPSMQEFLAICEYLGVEVKDFFDFDMKEPALIRIGADGLKKLSESDLLLVIGLINRLKKQL